jgi:hypothetical protein
MPLTRRDILRKTIGGAAALALIGGCIEKAPPYGMEAGILLPGHKRQVWAVAPVVNLSGEHAVEPILQADLVYQQLQQVHGLTVIPVNRTVEVLASLRLKQVQSEQQAAILCDLMGCNAIVVPTITAYDPYNPPKLGASLQLFVRPGDLARPATSVVDPRELARQAAPAADAPLPAGEGIIQVVGMYDAENGSVREALFRYAQGRNDPVGPLGAKEYLVSMDRYCGFVYHVLIADMLNSPKLRRTLNG